MERRLAAILAADVVGYSRQIGAAEEATLAQLADLRDVVNTRVAEAGGRIFSLAGDGILAEFASPVAAVRSGFEIQRDLAQRNREGSTSLELRIGIHLADVVIQGDDLLGDGVNIAARIEGAAAPGSVTVSRVVFDQVKRTASLVFEDLGEHTLRNITEPLHLYRVMREQDIHSQMPSSPALDEVQNSAPWADRPSIAVLPFSNLSGDPEQDYFADGFSEDLITELARFRALLVISRNASFGYHGRDVDPRQVGRNLGVNHCLQGSVRKLGTRIRITAQLIDTSTGEHVWADRFDCVLQDLFDVQDDLAAKIVGTIADRVEASATAAAKRKRPTDLDAFDCLLHGLEHHRLGGVTLENAKQAIAWLDRAIEIDPSYGRAHAWRACAVASLRDWTGNPELWDDAVASARRALDLDPNEGETHRIMGSIYLETRQYDKAEYHFHRGLEINPNHAYIAAKTAALYNYTARPEKSLELLARAKRLDPSLPDYCGEEGVVARYVSGQYADALAAAAAMTRLTRRAAVYTAAAGAHCDGTDIRKHAKAVLRIDPHFSIKDFVGHEPFKDREQRKRLAADLAHAGLAKET